MPLSFVSFAASMGFIFSHLLSAQTAAPVFDSVPERPAPVVPFNVGSHMNEPSYRLKAQSTHKKPGSSGSGVSAQKTHVKPSIERGIYLFGQGNTAAAFMTFDQLTLSVDPSDSKQAVPFCLRGVCSLMINNFEWAGKDFDKCLELLDVGSQLQSGSQPQLSEPIRTSINGGIVCAMSVANVNKTLELNRLSLVLGVGDKASLHLENGRLYFLSGDRERSLHELDEAQDLNSSLKSDCDLVRALWQRPDTEVARKEAQETFANQATTKRNQFIDAVKKHLKEEADKFFDKEIFELMRQAQIAAETYAVEHRGRYPMTIERLEPYIIYNTNALTGETVWPTLGKPIDVAKVRQARPEKLAKGAIEYTPLEGGIRYAVRGGDHQGMALRNRDGTMVLSNQ